LDVQLLSWVLGEFASGLADGDISAVARQQKAAFTPAEGAPLEPVLREYLSLVDCVVTTKRCQPGFTPTAETVLQRELLNDFHEFVLVHYGLPLAKQASRIAKALANPGKYSITVAGIISDVLGQRHLLKVPADAHPTRDATHTYDKTIGILVAKESKTSSRRYRRESIYVCDSSNESGADENLAPLRSDNYQNKGRRGADDTKIYGDSANPDHIKAYVSDEVRKSHFMDMCALLDDVSVKFKKETGNALPCLNCLGKADPKPHQFLDCPCNWFRPQNFNDMADKLNLPGYQRRLLPAHPSHYVTARNMRDAMTGVAPFRSELERHHCREEAGERHKGGGGRRTSRWYL
jgi:hypothetical protein